MIKLLAKLFTDPNYKLDPEQADLIGGSAAVIALVLIVIIATFIRYS